MHETYSDDFVKSLKKFISIKIGDRAVALQEIFNFSWLICC